MSQRASIRFALLGIVAFLITAFAVGSVQSQPGRPGAGFTGVPRPPAFPKIPQPPTFPKIPQPPPFNPPTFPRGPAFETVWSCGKCRAELGRGDTKPSFASCPKCGVSFVNGGGGGFGLVRPPPPSDLGKGPIDPDLLPRNTGGASLDAPSTQASSEPTTATQATEPEKPVSRSGSMILKIMIGVFALLFVLGLAGGAFLIIAANKGSKPAKRSARRRDDDDD